MNRTDLTRDTYNKIASEYEQNGMRYAATDELENFVSKIPTGGKILDAGCGFGRELLFFAKQGFETYGIDGSKELLKLAGKRVPKARLQLVDLRDKLPFDDNFFDGVWARNSLHHLETKDLQHALSEIKRILKGNGVFFVEWKAGEGEVVTEEEIAAGQKRFYNLHSKEEVEALLKGAGFEILEAYTYNWSERYDGKREYSDFIVVLAKKS